MCCERDDIRNTKKKSITLVRQNESLQCIFIQPKSFLVFLAIICCDCFFYNSQSLSQEYVFSRHIFQKIRYDIEFQGEMEDEERYLSSKILKEKNVPFLLGLVCVLCASFYSIYARVLGLFGLAVAFVLRDVFATTEKKKISSSSKQKIESSSTYTLLPTLTLGDKYVIQDNDAVIRIVSYLDWSTLLRLEACSRSWRYKCIRSSQIKVLNLAWKRSFRSYFPDRTYSAALTFVKEKYGNSWRKLFRTEFHVYSDLKSQFDWLSKNTEELFHLCQSDRRARRLEKILEFIPDCQFCELPECKCKHMPFVDGHGSDYADYVSKENSLGRFHANITIDDCGRSMLCIACRSGSFRACKILMRKGANANHRDAFGNSTFFLYFVVVVVVSVDSHTHT